MERKQQGKKGKCAISLYNIESNADFIQCERCGSYSCKRCCQEIVDLCEKMKVTDDEWLSNVQRILGEETGRCTNESFIG